jgi:hypothetical protein
MDLQVEVRQATFELYRDGLVTVRGPDEAEDVCAISLREYVVSSVE